MAVLALPHVQPNRIETDLHTPGRIRAAALWADRAAEQTSEESWVVLSAPAAHSIVIRTTIAVDDLPRLKAEEIQRQLSLLRQQQDRLLNLRLLGELEDATMSEKATELRDREANFKLQLDACDLGRHENAEIAIKAFELSQNLRAKWLTADYAEKRRVLEIVFLNFVLDDVTLVPETRKPFDMLAEGPLVLSSRGEKI